MSITTVSNCKAFRGIDASNTEHDAELTRLIPAVQAFMEQECARKFDQATVTEYFNGRGFVYSSNYGFGYGVNGVGVGIGRRYGVDEWTEKASSDRLMVARPPIISITNIWDDPLRVYPTPISTANYLIADAEAGIIRLDQLIFLRGIANIKVTYLGGYSPIPADLEQAAIEMVWAAREKGSNNLIGVRSRALAGDSVQYVNLAWPLDLGMILDKYSFGLGVG